jgi:integrase
MAQALTNFRPTFAKRHGIVRGVAKLGRVRERKTPGGKTRWFIDFGQHYGRIYRGRDDLGEWDFDSFEDAERYLGRIRSRVEDGRDPDAVLDQIRPQARRTIPTLAAKWLDYKLEQVRAKEIEARSYRIMDGVVRNHFPYWKDTPAEGLTKGQLEDWRVHLSAEKKLEPDTVRHTLATLRNFMGWLYDREEIARIPRFPTVTVPERSPKLLTRDQQSKVLAAIPAEHRGIFIALVDCGLRPSEARALQRPHVRADGWILVRQAAKERGHTAPIGPTKTKRNREVPPLTDRIHEWLAAYPPKGMLLFPSPEDKDSHGNSRGWMWSHGEIARVWNAACLAVGVEARPYEGTKHSTGTSLREQGHPLEAIKGLFGHSSVVMTQKYAKPRPAELIRLREKK